MKLYTAPRAPNPKRVRMFMAEKGITDIELINVDLNAQAHKAADYAAKSPLSRVPALALDDGRHLSESRAICTYLEGLYPEPNLMGNDASERAFIEMADRLVEWYIMLPTAQWTRHSHPGLAVLENPQFPEFGASQGDKRQTGLSWLEQRLSTHAWVAADRFTVADITAFCTIEFSRLMKFKPAEAGYPAIQAWRDRVAERDSAKAGDS
jgi:glutathione S-transferase